MILEMFPETGDRNNLPCERGQISSRNKEARINNTVNSVEYFGTSSVYDFNSLTSTVPGKTQPIDSLTRFPYRFLVVCDKTCLTKVGFTALDTLLHTWRSLSMAQPSSRKNSNAYALMSSVLFQRIKSFGENVSCGR